ncbi:MAG: CmcI family methyltransferase [Pirellulales bacterium]|jgi:cephalosporin hydroxylase|nr:CmcI family methyltransferase [Pirellulales bacterium]
MIVDYEKNIVEVIDEQGNCKTYPFESAEAFREISKAWLRIGWDTKYVYSFTWLGRPIIQLPDDMIRLQEVIYAVKPDVIVETGIAHGGSLVYSASLCQIMGKGRVVGVDIEIRPKNRKAIEAHPLFPMITMFEGDSAAEEIVDEVKGQIQPGESVLVLLDSGHSRDHVMRELLAYGPLVTPGSYIVAMDGIMQDLVGAPRTDPDWGINNPQTAVRDFLQEHPEFVLEEPTHPFNEGMIQDRVTYWPNCFLKRKE